VEKDLTGNSRIHIKEIDKQLAVQFVQTYHYSQIMPRLTKYYLGIFKGNLLCGVITLGWGTQPLQTIKKLFPNESFVTADYLEIGKMCFLPQFNNGNFGSIALSVLVKWCRNNTSITFLYTLADGIMGKCGYVYQASNFKYIGSFKTSVYMDIRTGEKIHPRSAKTLCEENARWEGKRKVFWLTDDFCKYKGIDKINGLMFRYIYPINKQARSILKNTYPEMPNPKDADLKFEKRIRNGVFEKIPQPTFNMRVFEHNFQKGMVIP
jgi:hypothetical protein